MREIAVILLVLPDGRLVLQRRDDKAPISPNKLAMFGGHIEPGESPDQAVRRELGEETSLSAADLTIQHVRDYRILFPEQNNEEVQFYLFKADVPNADFTVYEGTGLEVHTAKAALARQDITDSTRYALTKLETN